MRTIVRSGTSIAVFATLVATAAIAIPLAVHTSIADDVDPGLARPVRHTRPVEAPTPGGAPSATEAPAVRFARFPLDMGWAETYGSNVVNGPSPGAGGVSMPEGHCSEGVLFGSGYQDKLSTYVTTEESSRTREILGYASADAARSAFRALGDAVAGCPVFADRYSGAMSYSAKVYGSIDEANLRAGLTTLTFAYTSSGSAPFGVVYQFAIVDDVLYGSNHYGDWTADTASEGVAALDGDNAGLTSLLPTIKR